MVVAYLAYERLPGFHMVACLPFASDEINIVASCTSGGTISPSGIITVSFSASQTFTIKTNPKYMIFRVLVDCNPIMITNPIEMTYTFTNLTSNRIISAEDAPFDKFGHNYTARIFVGKADGADRGIDRAFWGNAVCTNDLLIMKWARYRMVHYLMVQTGLPDAWVDNEWNGSVPDGSGEVLHYKIICVGSELGNSSNRKEGGHSIRGQFEVIIDQIRSF
jgi:hypothetical protein